MGPAWMALFLVYRQKWRYEWRVSVRLDWYYSSGSLSVHRVGVKNAKSSYSDLLYPKSFSALPITVWTCSLRHQEASVEWQCQLIEALCDDLQSAVGSSIWRLVSRCHFRCLVLAMSLRSVETEVPCEGTSRTLCSLAGMYDVFSCSLVWLLRVLSCPVQAVLPLHLVIQGCESEKGLQWCFQLHLDLSLVQIMSQHWLLDFHQSMVTHFSRKHQN